MDLKVLSKSAPVDGLISYSTDLRVFLELIMAFLIAHHPLKHVFADQFERDIADLLEKAATVDIERSQALDATAIQDVVFQNTINLCRQIRDYGTFISSELGFDPTTENLVQARKILTACGVGVPVNLKSQSGLRRLLLIQSTGLEKLVVDEESELGKFKIQVDKALLDVETAIGNQVKEKMEAKMAFDELVIKSSKTIETVNRAIRLFKALSHKLPEELYTVLRNLQGQHHGMFYSKKNKPV